LGYFGKYKPSGQAARPFALGSSNLKKGLRPWNPNQFVQSFGPDGLGVAVQETDDVTSGSPWFFGHQLPATSGWAAGLSFKNQHNSMRLLNIVYFPAFQVCVHCPGPAGFRGKGLP